MKKILLVVLVTVFFLSGCNDQTEIIIEKPDIDISTGSALPSNGQNNESSEIPLNDDVDLSDDFTQVNSLKILYTADNTNKYYGIGDWQTYIQEKFGIEIYVDYLISTADDIRNGTMTRDGIIYLASFDALPDVYVTDIYRYCDQETAYDLSAYYRKYGWADYIDKEVMDELNVGGSIFAVPSASSRYIVPRYYNAEYISMLEMDVPDTIDEFHEYLIACEQLNKDDEKFFPMVISFMSPVKCTADIFRAFGVYFNSIWWQSAITLDPNTGTYENGVFAENIEEAVGFIRGLQQENLMIISGNRQYAPEGSELKEAGYFADKTLFSKDFATEYNVVFDKDRSEFIPYVIAESPYERINGYYLTHINAENVCEVRRDLTFFIFPKTIKNIDGTVDFFNQVFTDRAMGNDLRYGIEDKDYFVLDGTAVGERPSAGYFVDLRQIIPSENSSLPIMQESQAAVGNIPGNIAFETNAFNSIYTFYDMRKDKYAINMDRPLEVLFHMEISPGDAIEQYRSEFMKSGMLEVIKEANEKIGADPAYDYNP